MLLANKDGELIRATPGNYGAICPHCNVDVIPRCGTIKIWHWAHKVGDCVYHTEPETEWHMQWKERALQMGLEIEHDVTGERIHIADIYDPKTNTVIELQHSPISEEKILDRCSYYSMLNINIKWIFDKTQKYIQNNISIMGIEIMGNKLLFFDTLIPYSKTVLFRERYSSKSFLCLFTKGKPNYDTSLHIANYNYEPVLLRINQLLCRDSYDCGELYIFGKSIKKI